MCATSILVFLSYAIGDCFSTICIGYAAVFETIKQLSIEKVTQLITSTHLKLYVLVHTWGY